MLQGVAAATRRPAALRHMSSTHAAAALPPGVDPWPCANKPVEEATTLPASWYTSPAIPPLEASRVFGASWQLVGRLDQVAEAGQYFCGAVAPWRFLVARGDDGRLRAFHNVSERCSRLHDRFAEYGWDWPRQPASQTFDQNRDRRCHHRTRYAEPQTATTTAPRRRSAATTPRRSPPAAAAARTPSSAPTTAGRTTCRGACARRRASRA